MNQRKQLSSKSGIDDSHVAEVLMGCRVPRFQLYHYGNAFWAVICNLHIVEGI